MDSASRPLFGFVSPEITAHGSFGLDTAEVTAELTQQRKRTWDAESPTEMIERDDLAALADWTPSSESTPTSHKPAKRGAAPPEAPRKPRNQDDRLRRDVIARRGTLEFETASGAIPWAGVAAFLVTVATATSVWFLWSPIGGDQFITSFLR